MLSRRVHAHLHNRAPKFRSAEHLPALTQWRTRYFKIPTCISITSTRWGERKSGRQVPAATVQPGFSSLDPNIQGNIFLLPGLIMTRLHGRIAWLTKYGNPCPHSCMPFESPADWEPRWGISDTLVPVRPRVVEDCSVLSWQN